MTKEMKILLAQEKQLQFSHFGASEAWEIGTQLRKRALEASLPIAIDISTNGRCLFHWADDNTAAHNGAWIERKKRSVLRFNRSTLYLQHQLAFEGKKAAERFFVDETEYGFAGGGFPIIVANVGVIGAIIISGLKPEEDHELCIEALAEKLGITKDLIRLS
ncbi:MAG: heme-degrading domain-containing protein [Sphaerochaetaceae bacterium]